MSNLPQVVALVSGVGVVFVGGRAAWALSALIASGKTGCSYVDHPAPRWGSYVHALRKLKIVIDTSMEAHGGPFAGHHARYILRSRVRILEEPGGE